jgi:hypothetical protein
LSEEPEESERLAVMGELAARIPFAGVIEIDIELDWLASDSAIASERRMVPPSSTVRRASTPASSSFERASAASAIRSA